MVIEAKNAAGIRRFSYNSRRQQTRVETETGNVQENRYDAEGLRFELLENGRRTSFVYHDGELLQEEGREEQGTSYHLGAGMEAFRRGQELSYYHRDEQLSTVFVTDGQGEIRNSYQYDAFGIPLETTEQLNNRIRYTGQQYDELTEQYYLRARYYNPVAGRFMQEDVYQGDGLNLYAYCGNNPVVYDDPSGYASTSIGKACPPQGKISESVDETSYGKSSSNCMELVPYYPANNGAESGTATINPSDIRFSQSSVNGASEIIDSMKAKGWDGDPIDVVRMPDGNLTTIDNTRVLAARYAEIDVQANVHAFDEVLPQDLDLIERLTTPKGVPQTWGDAVLLRIGKQNSGYRNTYPLGSNIIGWSGN